MSPDAILQIVLDTVSEYRAAMKPDYASELSTDGPLFGEGGALDSVGLVAVLIEVEQKVSDAAGKDISLMDDRALSRTRSPFRTPRTLADYAHALLAEGSGS